MVGSDSIAVIDGLNGCWLWSIHEVFSY